MNEVKNEIKILQNFKPAIQQPMTEDRLNGLMDILNYMISITPQHRDLNQILNKFQEAAQLLEDIKRKY